VEGDDDDRKEGSNNYPISRRGTAPHASEAAIAAIAAIVNEETDGIVQIMRGPYRGISRAVRSTCTTFVGFPQPDVDSYDNDLIGYRTVLED